VNIGWVVTVEGIERPVDWSTCAPVIPHKRFMVSYHLQGMLKLPAVATVILEAGQIPAEIWSLLQEAVAAESIFKVGVNLNLLGEFQSLDLDKGSCYGFHVALGVTEGNPPRPNGILMSVRVYTRVDDSTKEIVKNMSQSFSVEHTV